jgi:large subunit ribosomal protein L24
MRIKKGMMVRVIQGNHKGMEGKVLKIFPNTSRLIIEGVNLIKRSARPTQENPSGGFIEKEAALHSSNVVVLHNGEPTKIGYKFLADGTKVRMNKKTKAEINI